MTATVRRMISQQAQRAWEYAQAWLERRAHECRHCRECRLEVGPLENTCPHCGAAAPARVSISLLVVIVGVGFPLLAILVYLV